jgi:uncharacterized membrane protein required for colicin V production
VLLQDPSDAGRAFDLVAELQALGWIDRTALAVLLVFFVLGLFKGLIWQLSRIGILVVAYVVSGWWGHDLAAVLRGGSGDEAGGAPAEPSAQAGQTAQSVADAAATTGETTLYIAYAVLFLGVVIVLSLVAMMLKRLVDGTGLGFFDRIGGGVLGVATGACVVLALVFALHMFVPGSKLAAAAESSHALRLSQRAIDWLGRAVDDDLRAVLALQPLTPAEGPDAVPVEAGASRSGTGRGDAVPAVSPPPEGPGKQGGIR